MMRSFDAKEAAEDLRMLQEPGYGGGMNMCHNDGYYARSLVQKWGMSTTELQKRCQTEIDRSRNDELVAKVRDGGEKMLLAIVEDLVDRGETWQILLALEIALDDSAVPLSHRGVAAEDRLRGRRIKNFASSCGTLARSMESAKV